MHKFKLCVIWLAVIVSSLCICSCKSKSEPMADSSLLLNTIITITLYDSDNKDILDNCFKICEDYENLLSRTKENSEIYRLNEAGSLSVSDDTLEVIKKGLYYSEISNGAFDITIEPVSSLWDFSSENPEIPDEAALSEAVSKVNYEDVIIEGNTVSFKKDNMGIELGAIAKGYIADKIKEYLLSENVNSATINLGGNVLCVGHKENAEPFRIGIQDPFESRNETYGVVDIDDKSVVTSGVYERHFVLNGINYHHILNPQTGMPYDNGLVSVTIISKNSVDGDGLSTTCLALGLEKGMELINNIDDACGMFINSDNEVFYSNGFDPIN